MKIVDGVQCQVIRGIEMVSDRLPCRLVDSFVVLSVANAICLNPYIERIAFRCHSVVLSNYRFLYRRGTHFFERAPVSTTTSNGGINMSEQSYTVGQVAKLTGITTKQIRNWGKIGLLPEVPYLSYGNFHHRRYTQTHIDTMTHADVTSLALSYPIW